MALADFDADGWIDMHTTVMWSQRQALFVVLNHTYVADYCKLTFDFRVFTILVLLCTASSAQCNAPWLHTLFSISGLGVDLRPPYRYVGFGFGPDAVDRMADQLLLNDGAGHFHRRVRDVLRC